MDAFTKILAQLDRDLDTVARIAAIRDELARWNAMQEFRHDQVRRALARYR